MFATADPNSPDYGVTLLSCPFFETSLRQYNTVKIPIITYNNKNLDKELNLSYSDTGVDKGGKKNVANREIIEWSYTPTVSGSHTLRIKEDMSNKEVFFDVNVEEVALKVSENTNYEFKFKSTEFASNDTVQTWTTKDGSLIQFSENFDWENGGLKEEINDKGISEPVFVIKAGSTMTIPYKPFLKTGINGLGKTFKFIFKAKNCRSFHAPVLSCQVEQLRIITDSVPSSVIVALGSNIHYGKNVRINKETNTIEYRGSFDEMTYTQENLADEENRKKLLNTYILYQDQYYYCKEFNEQTSFIEDENGESVSVTYYVPNLHLVAIRPSYKGLRMEAQSAVFNSDINTISTQYCENSYIEYELNLNDKYMTSWIDGVPNSISLYDNIADSVLQPLQTAKYITIGSSECDVYIYLIKFYEVSLSTEDHFGNFVLDATNATEMIERYTRNDILDQKNEISPVLLAMKNPDCKVHVYTIPRITTSKNDKIKNCEYVQY
jgi:hypothetical protein